MADSALTPIIVLKPRVASDADLEALRKAGYIVLQSEDPECVKVIHGINVGNGDVVYHAAIEAVNRSPVNSAARNRFDEVLLSYISNRTKPVK